MIIKNKNQKGFTLVELLISISIFAMTVLLISGIYLAFSKSQAKAKASQTLLNNAQYTLEIMAREIRNSSIYDYNPNVAGGMCGSVSCCEYHIGSNYESCILLQKEDGRLIAFVADLRAEEKKLFYVVPPASSYLSSPWENSSSAFTTLLASDLNTDPGDDGEFYNDVIVDDLDFYILPSTDPFESGGPNVQPKVTIALKASYDAEQIVAQVSYLLQTTVSSRIYKR